MGVIVWGSLELLKPKIIRSYKIAIPHWHDNKMQLLLPLNLTSESRSRLGACRG
jgi:hypothetical protein